MVQEGDKMEKIVSATEAPEDILVNMSEEKKKEIMERLQEIKGQVEKLAEKKQEQAREVLFMLAQINQEVRANLVATAGLSTAMRTGYKTENIIKLADAQIIGSLELLQKIDEQYLLFIKAIMHEKEPA